MCLCWFAGSLRVTGLCGWHRWVTSPWTSTMRSIKTGLVCRYTRCRSSQQYESTQSDTRFNKSFFLSFSWWQPVTLSRPSSTTGSVDTSTFRSSTSKYMLGFVRSIRFVKQGRALFRSDFCLLYIWFWIKLATWKMTTEIRKQNVKKFESIEKMTFSCLQFLM